MPICTCFFSVWLHNMMIVSYPAPVHTNPLGSSNSITNASSVQLHRMLMFVLHIYDGFARTSTVQSRAFLYRFHDMHCRLNLPYTLIHI